ncbi:MAG: hypothetical protein OEU32_09600 [Acidimicrobiia bacterium]|nr:hypothetical protein [Acidimicrobiia bacterium]
MNADLFAEPIHVESQADCEFYHSIELKNGERTAGKWDLDYDEYLGHVDVAGKLALDIGTANGALTWAMEDRGADVIGYDLSIDDEWDVIPSMHDDHRATFESRAEIVSRLHRGWWYCHERNQSKARAVYGHVYDLPVELGPVDISVFGAILLHLRDPFRALQAASRITSETIVVTEMLPKIPEAALELPVAKLMPVPEGRLHLWTWWHLTPELVVRMLDLLGFGDASVSYHTQKQVSGDQSMYTVVANRTLDLDPHRGF